LPSVSRYHDAQLCIAARSAATTGTSAASAFAAAAPRRRGTSARAARGRTALNASARAARCPTALDIGTGFSSPRAGIAFESTAAGGAAFDPATLLDAGASTSFDAGAATLLNANAPTFLDTAASLETATAALLKADSAAFSDRTFRAPAVPTCRPAPSKSGTEAVAAPIPARPIPAVIIEAEIVAGPPVQNLIDHRHVLQRSINSALRDRGSLRWDRQTAAHQKRSRYQFEIRHERFLLK
jgi:hypothetical protein